MVPFDTFVDQYIKPVKWLVALASTVGLSTSSEINRFQHQQISSKWAEGSIRAEEDQDVMKRCGQHGDEKKGIHSLSAHPSALYAPLTAVIDVIDKHTLLLCIMTDYIR